MTHPESSGSLTDLAIEQKREFVARCLAALGATDWLPDGDDNLPRQLATTWARHRELEASGEDYIDITEEWGLNTSHSYAVFASSMTNNFDPVSSRSARHSVRTLEFWLEYDDASDEFGPAQCKATYDVRPGFAHDIRMDKRLGNDVLAMIGYGRPAANNLERSSDDKIDQGLRDAHDRDPRVHYEEVMNRLDPANLISQANSIDESATLL